MTRISRLVAGFCICCKERVLQKRNSIQIESSSEDLNTPDTLEFAGTDQLYEITKIDKVKKTNETQLILVQKNYSSMIEAIRSMKQRSKALEEKET